MKIQFNDIFVDCTSDGTKIPKESYLKSGKYIIIDQGQNQIAGFTNQEEGVYSDVPAIIFGDHTRVIKYVDKPFFLGADGVKLLKSVKKDVNYKYLYYALLNLKVLNLGYNRHFKLLKESNIEYCDVNTQNSIVKVLDKINNIIQKHKKVMSSLDTLIKAKFVEMFGDPVNNSKHLEVKTLSELGEFGRGVSKHRPRNDPKLLDGKYPLIQTGDIASADLYIENYNSTYSEIGLKQSKMWKKGTLCITIAANIANTAILDFDACFPDSIVGFNSNGQINNIFMHYWFSFFQSIIYKQAPAVAQKNINLDILSKFKVIAPPLELQEQFAAFAKEVDKLKFDVKKSLEKTQMIFDSLMQQYFGYIDL